MKISIKTAVILVGLLFGYEVAHLTLFQDSDGWATMAWIESVSDDGPSANAAPEDVGRFSKVLSFEGEPSTPLVDYLTLASLTLTVASAWVLWAREKPSIRANRWRVVFALGLISFLSVTSLALSGVIAETEKITPEAWNEVVDKLQVGDVIAYRKEKWSARRELFAKGKLTVIGYRLFKYGHLAIVVEDPNAPGRKVLFTSESAKGVNVDEDANSLQTHNWDAYRLDKWDRIDLGRIREGILRCKEKSGNFFGYDFTGMFALWNEDLKPDHAEDFGTEYICSTSVVTLLYFGGFESDATPRQELDLITPYQVVRAKGRFVKPPDLPGEE